MARIWTSLFVVVIIGGSLVETSHAWLSSSPLATTISAGAHHHDRCIRGTSSSTRQWATVKDNEQTKRSETTTTKPSLSADETTQKYGLEVGLMQSLFSKKENDGGGESAKSLLKRYGIAYLVTSIPLAVVSFAICYYLVDQGVNVSQLLNQVGIKSAESSTVETAGTLAIAYAAHKAASPIRFPPTVILTPIVAKWIGKEPQEEGEEAK